MDQRLVVDRAVLKLVVNGFEPPTLQSTRVVRAQNAVTRPPPTFSVETRKPGEVAGEGQGRKAPREALQWRGDGGHAIVMSKLLDQFQQSCGGAPCEIAGSGEQNSPA
jgi:hypothetical protein